MTFPLQLPALVASMLYQAIACGLEDREAPPGQRYAIAGTHLHLCVTEVAMPERSGIVPTLVLDHSLGGVEGYLLAEQLSQLGRVCIYDRAGYGWSDQSLQPRTSTQIVTELDQLLTAAKIAPPYLLIGDSFGTYNMRLYAHCYPEKVVGMVLTDGLHEDGMLNMPLALQMLQGLFISGFAMATVGSFLGIIRILKVCGGFECLKPELRQFSPSALRAVTRSFCRPKHWITMMRELANLRTSGQQVAVAEHLGALPIVNIKASSFFKPAIWTVLIPLGSANQLRDRMHDALLRLSTRCDQLMAANSGHFVWVDEPEVMLTAVKQVLGKVVEEG